MSSEFRSSSASRGVSFITGGFIILEATKILVNYLALTKPKLSSTAKYLCLSEAVEGELK